ncbi:hypothetical protein AMK27_10255 [Streptomyces sp. CB02009]|nr:hypothetical protein AMK27_10255 [Streptomyces sp. CB02009]
MWGYNAGKQYLVNAPDVHKHIAAAPANRTFPVDRRTGTRTHARSGRDEHHGIPQRRRELKQCPPTRRTPAGADGELRPSKCHNAVTHEGVS